LQSFSAVQKAELKKITKKLDKANSDVTKRSKALTSDLERSRIARQQISGVAERLDKHSTMSRPGNLRLEVRWGFRAKVALNEYSQRVALNDSRVDQTTTSCPVIRALQRELRGNGERPRQ
jgi:hypothetical protein